MPAKVSAKVIVVVVVCDNDKNRIESTAVSAIARHYGKF